ncbi:MAG: DEAD/DEAH box helicase, partial [Bacteroidaceae bacterium]|nr:DEAD/DEAH box helicase [Bacteroidaceae bacterium]
DRMLDMGFYDDIMQIVKLLPENRHTIMFSATMPQIIQQLAKTILHDPVEVKIAVSRPADKIKQSAYICYEKQKLGLIRWIFRHEEAKRVIIFASKKIKVKDVTRSLKQIGMNVSEMHSDLDQAKRDEVMLGFKNSHINILVATDILSRGIDIDDIQMVINYDVPHDYEDYVHRIGRTARAGNDGAALTFVSPDDFHYFKQIEDFLGKKIERLDIPEELGGNPEPEIMQEKRNHNNKSKKSKGNRRQNVHRSKDTKQSAVKASNEDPQKSRNQDKKPKRQPRRKKPMNSSSEKTADKN